MKERKQIALNFFVDKLTNSIENVQSGDSFPTNIILLSTDDLKLITKKKGWQFNWKHELKQPEREIYKLSIPNNLSVIQGLISIETKSDHIFIHLIESAPFNKGKNKIYSGVPGNLVAFACRHSFQRGFEGNVSFISKTRLVEHYIKTLGAMHFGSGLMVIETRAALQLIQKYFKNIFS